MIKHIPHILATVIKDNEEVIGYFKTMETPQSWILILFTNIATLMSKYYLTIITDQGVHMQRFSLMESPKEHFFYPWVNISKMSFAEKGIFQLSYTFQLKNHPNIRILKAQKKAFKGIPTLDATTKNYIQSRVQ